MQRGCEIFIVINSFLFFQFIKEQSFTLSLAVQFYISLFSILNVHKSILSGSFISAQSVVAGT